MCNLTPRFSCQKCPPSARCAAFVGSDIDPRTQAAIPRLNPISPAEICRGCNHPWICHEALGCTDNTHPNYHFRKGGYPTNACGGFHSQTVNWDYLTVCVCLAQWMSHLPLPAAEGAPNTLGAAFQAAPAPGSPPGLPFSAPPITAYLGLPPVIRGGVGARRTSSAEQTLPQHTTNGTRPPRRGPRNPYPAASTGATSSRSTSGIFSADASVLVAVYPLVEPGVHEIPGHPTHSLVLSNPILLDFLHRLELHGLLVTIRVPRQGITSPTDFTRQIEASLSAKSLTLPESPHSLSDSESDQLHKQPWSLSHATRRNHVFKFAAHPTINANNFGIDEFRRLDKKVPNLTPADGTPKPLIFISPRFGNIAGAINSPTFSQQDLPNSGLFLSHPCLGIRALDGLPYTNSAYPPDAECYDGVCPQEEDDMRPITPPPPPPTTSTSLIRPRGSPETPTHRRVRQRQLGALSYLAPVAVPASPPAIRLVPSPRLSLALPPPPSPPPPPFIILQRADVAPLVIGPHLAHPGDVYMWQIGLGSEVVGISSLPRFTMHAETVEAAAAALWAFLLHFEQRVSIAEAFPLPAGIVSFPRLQSKQSFFRDIRVMRIGVRRLADGSLREISTGPGPERAVYHMAVATAVHNSQFWIEAGSSGFYIPVFSTMSFVAIYDRCQAFAAFGSLLALHCYVLGQGPFPVSVWLLVALALGRPGMLIPNSVLAALDPIAFDMLAPWLTMTPDDPIPSSLSHPLCQFLLNIMEIQPSQVTAPRTQQVHDGWTIAFMSKVLLGSDTPWNHPEFLALKRGFDITVGDSSVINRLSVHRPALAVLTCLYDRQIRKVEDVSDRLGFHITRAGDDGTTPLFAALFRLLFRRYLVATGHPLQLHGLVIEEEKWMADADNELLRVGLLLEAATDADLRPVSSSWSISFHIGASYVDDTNDDAEPRPLHFHTCSYDVDVKLTRAMEYLIVQSCEKLDDPTYSSDFDAWIHCQLLARDHNTI